MRRLRHAARPPEVVILAALLAVAAICLLAAVLFPMSDRAPVAWGWGLLPVALGMAAFTWLAGARVPRGVLLGEAVTALLMNSVLVAQSATLGGALGTAVAYTWLTVYVAVFFPRAALAFSGLACAGFGAGLLQAGVPGGLVPWIIVSLTAVALAVMLSHFSRFVRDRMRTDDLTGALNRGGLDEVAARVVARARRRTEALAVAALDLDGFKQVNDQRGHAQGDRLLVEAADAWRGALRDGDVLARTGGDEFVVLLPNTSEAEAAAVLERLRASHPVAWSAGVTHLQDGETLAACLERADRRLYAAKSQR